MTPTAGNFRASPGDPSWPLATTCGPIPGWETVQCHSSIEVPHVMIEDASDWESDRSDNGDESDASSTYSFDWSDTHQGIPQPLPQSHVGTGTPTLFAAPYTRALPRELVDIIFHHVASEQAVIGEHYRHKEEFAGLSRVCRRWSLLLRPFLFCELYLHSLSDIRFLASVVRSPLSASLAAHIGTIRLDVPKATKDTSPIQLMSSEWRDLRAAAPALRSLVFNGGYEKPWMFPWRQRDGLRTLTTLRSIRIQDFRFPSFS